MSVNGPSPDELLRHLDWIQSLARRLVGDPALADDIAQETWLAASQSESSGTRNVKPWLASIVRNRARMAGRSRSRRRLHEGAAAGPTESESTAALVARVSLQKDLLGRVLQLEEPLQQILLLRYFEELPAPAIAQRLGLPLKTVHSRTARGLERLRERLDKDYGDRASWAVALTPLCKPPGGAAGTAPVFLTTLTPTAALAAGTLMNSKVAAAVVVSVLVCGYALSHLMGSSPVDPPQHATAELSPQQPALDLPVDEALSMPVAEQVRESAAMAATAAPAPSTPEPKALAPVRGRVLDTEGKPVAGVDVVRASRPNDVLATSDSLGAFEFAGRPGGRSNLAIDSDGQFLRASHPEWTTFRASAPGNSGGETEELVIVAPRVGLQCLVVNKDGLPIEGAKLALNPVMGGMQAFPYRIDSTRGVAVSALSHADGRITLESFPGCADLRLSLSAKGYVSTWIGLDDYEQPYVFELNRQADIGGTVVEGIVLDQRGAPVPGATVICGTNETLSEGDGLFRLVLAKAPEGLPLCAAAKGHQPALIADLGAKLEADGNGSFELVLGPETVSMKGRIVDGKGEPLAGCRVYLLDETALSTRQIPVTTAESVTRGLESPPTFLSRLSGDVTPTSDSKGRFTIKGLAAREYRVRVVDPKSLTRLDVVLMAGADEHRIELEVALRGPLAGRMVDRQGNPLEGVEVVVGQWTFEAAYGSQSISGSSTQTDADGAFDLGMVPMEGGFLDYRSDQVMFGRIALADVQVLDDLKVVASRLRHFKVELVNAQKADSFRLLDEDLNSVQINSFEEGGMRAFGMAPLDEGRSEPLSVADSAVWIVLMKGGKEVAREPLVFGPEEVTILRP